MFAGKKSAQIREILISESAWEEMTCLFAPSLKAAHTLRDGVILLKVIFFVSGTFSKWAKIASYFPVFCLLYQRLIFVSFV
ncbi:TPA: hypothetical protein MHZ82_23710 [Klebsiella pneumoniae subsp. pneumoniae]|nr:hypothetical protein [Klebsiella pneumoniae subsp. pneumoniae]